MGLHCKEKPAWQNNPRPLQLAFSISEEDLAGAERLWVPIPIVALASKLAVQSAYQLKSTSRWRYVTLSARRVKGDPFWKAIRPNGVPPGAQLKPDLVSSRFYTTCFTGVVVPYVCTTGSTVCGR
jgi:hypothetical protein